MLAIFKLFILFKVILGWDLVKFNNTLGLNIKGADIFIFNEHLLFVGGTNREEDHGITICDFYNTQEINNCSTLYSAYGSILTSVR